jgi:putative glutamine amidotransferase
VRAPTVGITTSIDANNFVSLRPEYARAVEKAGGVPMLLATAAPDQALALLDRVDALLLSGGSDVDPGLFGEEPHPTSRWVRGRDDFELAVTREALRRDMPVLAICRGQQVLNVALGGTLVQDIPTQFPQATQHYPKDVPRWHMAHDALVLPGTRLRAILGTDALPVNSFHHQAVRELGRDLRLAARGQDGVVEAIESTRHRFVIGVQWHPEAMWNRDPDHQELFRALVGAASPD